MIIKILNRPMNILQFDTTYFKRTFIVYTLNRNKPLVCNNPEICVCVYTSRACGVFRGGKVIAQFSRLLKIILTMIIANLVL